MEKHILHRGGDRSNESVVSATVAGCLRRDCVEKLKRPEPKHSSEGRRQGGGLVTSVGGTVHCNDRQG